MTGNRKRSEQGQVMILVVLGIIVLLGFAALAIDIGMLYSDRRIAQNAADASALAGAGAAGQDLKTLLVDEWDCGSGFNTAINDAKDAAIDQALFNQFVITRTLGITENVVIVNCSTSGNPNDNFLDVHVRIDKETQSTFSHLIYSGQLANTVTAVARVTPKMPFAGGNSIVSLTSNCGSHFDKGIVFGGNGNTIIDGGGIHSNSCLTLNGASGNIQVNGGGVEYDADDIYKNNGGMSISPSPVSTGDKILVDPLPDLCAGVAAAPPGGGPNELSPGRYNHIISINNNQVKTMRSGLYCLQNGIRVNGGGTLQSDAISDDTEGGVTIVVLNGNFDVAGNATVKLKAPPPDCDAVADSYGLTCPLAVPGMLIYLPPGSNGNVSIAGTADSEYTGTVYAPDGYIDVGGTTSTITDIWAQFVAHSILIHGDTTLNIHYDTSVMFNFPARLNMQR
jgi:hypothetical protein